MLTRSKSRKELPPNPSHHSTLEHNGAPIVEPPVYDKNDIAFMNKCSSSINKIECFDNTRFRPTHMGSVNQTVLVVDKYDRKIARSIKCGKVRMSQVPSFAVDDYSKSSLYTDEEDHFDVTIRYSYPEGTLIPFGIGMEPRKTDVSLGTLPLSADTLVPLSFNRHEYDYIINDFDLFGYEYIVDRESGVRSFVKDGQRYYRVGDWLSLREIISGLQLAGDTCNAAAIWNYACLASIKKISLDIRYEKDKRKWDRDKSCIDESVKAISQFLNDVESAYATVGPPTAKVIPSRLNWREWNVADISFDDCRDPTFIQYCQDERAKAVETDRISNADTKLYLESQKQMHYFLCLLTSEQTKDELQFEQYLRLTHGRLSLTQLASPLSKVSMFEYFLYLERLLHRYSIAYKKACSILSLICTFSIKYRGRSSFITLPKDLGSLQSILNVNIKKAAVTLNACGFYVGIGGGGDMHMKRCCRPLVRPHWPKLKDGTVPNIDGKVIVAIRHMPLYPGLYAK